jgi:hypothetical protein
MGGDQPIVGKEDWCGEWQSLAAGVSAEQTTPDEEPDGEDDDREERDGGFEYDPDLEFDPNNPTGGYSAAEIEASGEPGNSDDGRDRQAAVDIHNESCDPDPYDAPRAVPGEGR